MEALRCRNCDTNIFGIKFITQNYTRIAQKLVKRMGMATLAITHHNRARRY